MNPSPFLLYLVEVERNSATFAVLTWWSGQEGTFEVRVPSPISQQNVDEVLYKFDKAAPLIEDWGQFYSWLGRGRGWAAFSPESAKKLVPDWLSAPSKYTCASIHGGSIKYVESSIRDEWESRIKEINLLGSSPEDDAARPLHQFIDNMVLARRPIF